MTGLPKKYAKMGFKKGWAAYRKVHPKGGKKKTTSKSPKKKTTKKKKGNPGKNAGGKVTSKKMSQGDIMMGNAWAGAGVRRFLAYQVNKNPKEITVGIPQDYTGYNIEAKAFEPERLVRGWGGPANEIIYRKICKDMLHTRPYPSKKSALELAAYYLKPAMDAWDNQGDAYRAYTAIYKDLHGVDLDRRGFDAYQPFEMMDTKGLLQLVKVGKKFAREAGVTLPKWM